MALRPQLQDIYERAEAILAKAERLKSVPGERLFASPGGDVWSPAQVLDHLNKSNALCLPKFADALATAKPGGGDVRYGLIDRALLKMMGPDAAIKVPVPPIFEPDARPKAPVPMFLKIQRELLEIIRKSDGFDLKGIRVTSPVSSRFRPGYMAYLEGLVLHEEYHWGQIEARLK